MANNNPDFTPKAQFPIAAIVDAIQKKAEYENQAQRQQAELFNNAIGQIGEIGKSLADRKRQVAQAMVLAKQYGIPEEDAKALDPDQIIAYGKNQQEQAQGKAVGNLIAGTEYGQKLLGMTPSGATGPNGQNVLMNQTAQGGVGVDPIPNAISQDTLSQAFRGTKPADLIKNLIAPQSTVTDQIAITDKDGNVIGYEDVERQKGGKTILSRPVGKSGGGQDPSDPMVQHKYEKEYIGQLSKNLSNRSGGLGLEDSKVNQAIHLRALINKFYDPATGTYNIPPSMHAELALGLAKLASPTGQVGIETMRELRQKTSREGLAGALIYLGADPNEVGGPTQDVAKLFIDSVDRQGRTAEENRQGYIDQLHGMASPDLEQSRRERLDKVKLGNSFNDVLTKSPDYQPPTQKPQLNPDLAHLSTEQLMNLRKQMTAHKEKKKIMAISLEDIDAELAAREPHGSQALSEIDAELARRGIQPEDSSPMKQVAIDAGRAAMMGPADATKAFMQSDPSSVQRKAGVALPIVGGVLGGPIGAAVGEFTRQATGTAFAPETVPKTPLGRFASVVTAGISENPAMIPAAIKALPGGQAINKFAGNVGEMASKAASSTGKGLAKLGEALTGAKAKDLEQAAKQGVSTYSAPSMEEAQGIFGGALKKEGISSKPSIEQIIDPQLTTARNTALEIGKKLEANAPITAEEALRARQATDRIYAATPISDRAARGHLADLRNAFDEIVTGQSDALANASRIYRKALVKSNLLNPFRITKQGQISAVAPMVAALASAGAGSQNKEAGIGSGLGYLALSSPLVAGLLATTGGSAARGAAALASRPEVRQAVSQLVQQLKNKYDERRKF